LSRVTAAVQPTDARKIDVINLARRITEALSVPLRGTPVGEPREQFAADVKMLNEIFCRLRRERDERSYAVRLAEARAEWIAALLREAVNDALEQAALAAAACDLAAKAAESIRALKKPTP
jgi:hypothetical protein